MKRADILHNSILYLSRGSFRYFKIDLIRHYIVLFHNGDKLFRKIILHALRRREVYLYIVKPQLIKLLTSDESAYLFHNDLTDAVYRSAFFRSRNKYFRREISIFFGFQPDKSLRRIKAFFP